MANNRRFVGRSTPGHYLVDAYFQKYQGAFAERMDHWDLRPFQDSLFRDRRPSAVLNRYQFHSTGLNVSYNFRPEQVALAPLMLQNTSQVSMGMCWSVMGFARHTRFSNDTTILPTDLRWDDGTPEFHSGCIRNLGIGPGAAASSPKYGE